MKSKGGSVWVSAHVRIRAGARGNPYRDQYRDIIVLLGVFFYVIGCYYVIFGPFQ